MKKAIQSTVLQLVLVTPMLFLMLNDISNILVWLSILFIPLTLANILSK